MCLNSPCCLSIAKICICWQWSIWLRWRMLAQEEEIKGKRVLRLTSTLLSTGGMRKFQPLWNPWWSDAGTPTMRSVPISTKSVMCLKQRPRNCLPSEAQEVQSQLKQYHPQMDAVPFNETNFSSLHKRTQFPSTSSNETSNKWSWCYLIAWQARMKQ